MNLAETLKLATKGFKPNDIRQIKEAGIETEEIVKLADNGYSVEDVNSLIQLTQEGTEELQPKTKESDDEPKQDPGTGEEASINYKEEIESKDEEIRKLQSKIAEIQNRNASRNLGSAPEKSNREKIQEAFATLY